MQKRSPLILKQPSTALSSFTARLAHETSGEYIAEGIGSGMDGYDFSTNAATVADKLEAAITAAFGFDAFLASG